MGTCRFKGPFGCPAAIFAAAAMLALALPIRADTIGFYNVSNNDDENAATAPQYKVDVSASGSVVTFRFSNDGPAASSITDVYFDDDQLFADPNGGAKKGKALPALTGIIESSGVVFVWGARPADLPAGNNADPEFEANELLGAGATTPTQPNGVNPGEELQLQLKLVSGKSWDDVLADLESGDLRIGIKVQGFDDDGSETFVSRAIPIPLPPALWGGAALMAVLGARKARTLWIERSA